MNISTVYQKACDCTQTMGLISISIMIMNISTVYQKASARTQTVELISISIMILLSITKHPLSLSV